MNATFYIHLIATIVNAFFLILLWWWNHKLISINYGLMKDNREILGEAKKIQERMNQIESSLPGTMWADITTNKIFTRVLEESNTQEKDK
jgi:hypothetical protein